MHWNGFILINEYSNFFVIFREIHVLKPWTMHKTSASAILKVDL
jgi:hypothetical protein